MSVKLSHIKAKKLININCMKAFLIAMLIVGTVIGAGFASGGEIAVYYAKFGYLAIPAIITTGALFYFLISLILKTNNRAQARGVRLNKYIFGRLSGAVEFVMIFNCFIVLSSMFAGSDVIGRAFFPALKNIPAVSALMFVLCFLVVRLGIKGMMRVNGIVVPLILAFIVVISLSGIFCMAGEVETVSNPLFLLINPFIYAGMNMLLAIGVMRGINISTKNIKKTALIASVLLSAVLILSTAAIVHTGSSGAEMPTIVIAENMGAVFKVIGGILILVAIFTTMQTAAYTLSGWMQLMLNSRSLSIMSILTIGWCLSRVGFSNIVTYIYPVTGVFGIIYFGVALVLELKEKRASVLLLNDKLLDKRYDKVHTGG